MKQKTYRKKQREKRKSECKREQELNNSYEIVSRQRKDKHLVQHGAECQNLIK